MKVFLTKRLLGIVACALLIPATVLAQDVWLATKVDNARFDLTPMESIPGGLPDGRKAYHHGEISSAWYGGPTTRYGHGILGDAIEASQLAVTMRGGRKLTFNLPETEVFEDRYPRLADLDGDGMTEIITIRSSVSEGASVTVYNVREGRLVQRAATGFIGLANRWLNIAGIADFRGTGKKQIAFVRTPHIGGTLFMYELDATGLKQVGSLDGFSNHVIGSREMRLSAVADIDGDGRMELALPSDDRRTLRIVGFRNNILTELGSADLPARIDKAIRGRGSRAEVRFTVGLDNSQFYAVHR